MSNLTSLLIGRLLCRIGIHNFQVIEIKFGFGTGGQVEVVECDRCGYKATRKPR